MLNSNYQSKDPALITNELALYFDTDIVAQRTLLFLDEIQAWEKNGDVGESLIC